MVASTPCHDSTGGQPLDMDFIDREMKFTPSERCTISCGTVCVDRNAAKVLIIFNKRLGIWQLPKGRKNIGEGLHAAALRETYEETGVRASLLPLKICTRSTKPVREERGSAGGPSYSPCQSLSSGPVDGSADSATLEVTNSAAGPETGHNVGTNSSSLVLGWPEPNGDPLGKPTVTIVEKNRVHDGGTYTYTARGDKETDSRRNNGFGSLGHTKGTGKPKPFTTAASVMVPVITDPKLTSNLPNNELIGIAQYPDLQAATPNTIKTVFFFAAFADSTEPMGPGAQDDHEDLCAEWVGFEEASQRLRFCSEREAMWKMKRDMKRSGVGFRYVQ